MKTRFLLLIALAAAAAAPRANAFLYEEHCLVSNQGLLLARHRAIAWTRPSLPEPIAHRLLELSQSSCLPNRGLSYGDLVALVDNTMSPIDFYLHVSNSNASFDFADGRLSNENLRTLASARLYHYRAASNNDDHFQDRALFVFHFYHRFAVHLAASEGNLVSALVVNAYADHFLQDALAPGHVRTPRRHLHNAAAIGLHDYYNRHGLIFWPHETQALAELVSEGAPAELEPLFRSAGGSMEAYLAALEEMGFPMFGDGRVERSPAQHIYLVLLSARSAMDLIESYVTGVAVNSFDTFEWTGYSASGNKRFSPSLAVAFGQYPSVEDSWMLAFIPVLGVSAGHQSLFRRNDGSSRVWLATELFVAGSPGTGWIATENGRRLGLPQLLLPVGYSVVAGAGVAGHGPMVRLVMPVSSIALQLSAVAGYRWYRSDDATSRGPHAGMRVEMGIGVLVVGAGVEYDRQLSSDGSFRPHLGLTSSITFALTTNQIFSF